MSLISHTCSCCCCLIEIHLSIFLQNTTNLSYERIVKDEERKKLERSLKYEYIMNCKIQRGGNIVN
jgi:hypothetical protein